MPRLAGLDLLIIPAGAPVTEGKLGRWRYMAGVAVLVILGGGLLSKKYHSEISQWVQRSHHYAQASVGYSRADSSSDATVTIGQFICSAKDAVQVKRLTPIDTLGQLQVDTEALEARQRELDDLKMQIAVAPSDYLQGPSNLDYRKQMVDQYSSLLDTYRADEAALKQRTSIFNSQSLAHESYLEQHCRRVGQ